MRTLLVLYPHCYIKSTDTEVLIYDTSNRNHVYLNNSPLSKTDKETLLMGYVTCNKVNDSFVNECIKHNVGYFVDCPKTLPFMRKRNLTFITSLQKERNALGYNLSSYTNLLLKTITIQLCNSQIDLYPVEVFKQIEYPDNNELKIDLHTIFNQLLPFLNLERVILSGEIDSDTFIEILRILQNKNVYVTHRLFFKIENIDNIISLLDSFEKLTIELLVDNSKPFEQLSRINHERIFIKAIIESIDDIEYFSNLKNVIYTPILSANNDKSTDLLNQMIITKKEVLNTSKSLKDCLTSDYINTGIYGHLSISNNGLVTSLNQKIGSIHEQDLACIINSWVSKDDCMWYYVRGMKEQCKNCALQSICPPISIYEDMGYFKCPCLT